jgi:hypothetical protein
MERESSSTGIAKFGWAAVIVAHGLVGWAFCGAIVGVGRQVLSMQTTLVIHAIGAPLGFGLLSLFYFKRFGYTGPLATALSFLAVVVTLDLLVVAPFIEGSFAMFSSVLGTWLPFALIFTSTYAVGLLVRKGAGSRD